MEVEEKKKPKQKKSKRHLHDDGYDDNFFKDSDDERKLNEMKDIEREEVINKRRENRERQREVEEMNRRL